MVQIRFVELVANALRDDLLGFHLAKSLDLREMGLLYYVSASSETLGDALRRLERYSTIGNEGVALRVCEGEDLVVTFHHVGVERPLDRHQIECFVTLLVRLSRQLTNCRLLPKRVSFRHHREGNRSEFDRFMGCDVVFGAEADVVALPGTVKEMRVVSAHPHLSKLLIKYAEEACRHRERVKDTLRARVEKTIALLLPHGKAHMAEIARQLGMSPRTLARRLASEGLTFVRVLAELRTDLAQRYVRDKHLAICQIAWLLGYQEARAFTHAFRRLTGKTLKEARALEETPHDRKPRPKARDAATEHLFWIFRAPTVEQATSSRVD
jgi:AraC-like DNA-binding protein